MRCRELFNALVQLDQGSGEIDTRVSSELLTKDMINLVQTRETAADESTLSELKKTNHERKQVIDGLTKLELKAGGKGPSKLPVSDKEKYNNLQIELSNLTNKSIELRGKLLKASAVPSIDDTVILKDRRSVQITFHGRKVMQEIGSRLNRVGEMEYDLHEKQMNQLVKSFKRTSKNAKDILKELSPALSEVEEIHLRSVAIGLSNLKIQPKKAVKTFKSFMKLNKKRMQKNNRRMAAEVLTILSVQDKKRQDRWSSTKKMQNLEKNLRWSRSSLHEKTNAVERATTILFSAPEDKIPSIIKGMDDIERMMFNIYYPAMALLGLEISEGEEAAVVLERFNKFLEMIESREDKSTSNKDKHTAAALLTSSELPMDELIQRFKIADKLLGDLFLTRMDTASSLISIMAQDIAETVDNIRIASAEIMKAKMSLSGLENFSLGLKMVMHTSTLENREIPPELLGLSILIPAAAVEIPFLVFHEELVHRIAVRHHRFHPVHSHYVYG
jgi:hypothetical protein